MFKLLVERRGVLFSITTKARAYFFFVCTKKLFAIKSAPTTDPYPGIVEVCGYDIERIVKNWSTISNIKLKRKKT